MKFRFFHLSLLCVLLYAVSSCTPGRNFTTRYYFENKGALDSIHDRFKLSYSKKPFNIEFKDKNFRHISFEILSDTFRYIYNFDLLEPKLADTLYKYKYNAAEIITLIADMQSVRCTWISNLDYYENQQKKSLVFISVRHNKLESFLMNGEKYYALAFFNERQFFDPKGRLTDKSEKKRMREINGQIFRRITDRICYAITGNFR